MLHEQLIKGVQIYQSTWSPSSAVQPGWVREGWVVNCTVCKVPALASVLATETTTTSDSHTADCSNAAGW